MSGVDIAGLVGRLRHFATHPGCSRALNQVCSDAADAFFVQAAEMAAKDSWVMHWQTKCQATRALEIEATRQRDEALAALKALEERGERLSSELASARLRPEPSGVEAAGWVARAPRSTRWAVVDEPDWYRENGWDVAAFGQPEAQAIECEECSGVGHTGIDREEVYDCPACLGEGKLTPLREAQWKLKALEAEYDHAKSLFDNHRAELDDISAAIGTTRFMDPPDGGYVPLATQVRRMREALEKAETGHDTQ